LQGRPSATAGTVAARLPMRHRHWRRVGQTRPPVGSGSTPSPLPFCAATEE